MDDVFSDKDRQESALLIQREADARAKQLRINYGVTFSSENGFEVLKDLAIHGHFLATTYVQGDQVESAFRMGEQNMLLYILSQLSDEMKSKLIGG
jgi:triosephosphate isomerase